MKQIQNQASTAGKCVGREGKCSADQIKYTAWFIPEAIGWIMTSGVNWVIKDGGMKMFFHILKNRRIFKVQMPPITATGGLNGQSVWYRK